MSPGLEKRLARLHAPIGWQERRDRLRRLSCCIRVLMGDLVRGCLVEWGIDPARARELGSADKAAAELAKIAGSDELDDATARAFAAEFETANAFLLTDRRALKYGERYWRDKTAEPDFEQASLLDLFGWCEARKYGDRLFGEIKFRSTQDY